MTHSAHRTSRVALAAHGSSFKWAQFACTVSGADQTCINSGTATGSALATGARNATTTSIGPVNGFVLTQTNAGSNC